MMARLEHAVDRTRMVFDQLGALWGPEVHPNLSLHGLSHEQIHLLGGPEIVFEDDGRSPEYVIGTRLPTPLGWEVAIFGDADLTCEQCRRLARLDSEHRESLQMIGILEPEPVP